ncbi:MAG: chemotaxis protein CheD [Solirubrobacteraceae bacterium]
MTGESEETMVRMGELSVSRTPGHVLASIGLGSCIGLVLIEAQRPLAGLAHIVLPASSSGSDAVGKFADSAVPALIEQMTAIGAMRSRLHAVLVGGAHMFALESASSLDIGRRNEQAAREALARAGLEVRAAATGGNKGRTVRVYVDEGRVTVKEPGEDHVEIFSSLQAAGALR